MQRAPTLVERCPGVADPLRRFPKTPLVPLRIQSRNENHRSSRSTDSYELPNCAARQLQPSVPANSYRPLPAGCSTRQCCEGDEPCRWQLQYSRRLQQDDRSENHNLRVGQRKNQWIGPWPRGRSLSLDPNERRGEEPREYHRRCTMAPETVRVFEAVSRPGS